MTLDDAPSSVAANGIEPDLLVVHQQDIQAVVNALLERRGGGNDDPRAAGDLDDCGEVRWQHGRAARHPVQPAVRRSARLATKHGCTTHSPHPSRSRSISSTSSPTGWSSGRSLSPRSDFPAHEGSLDLVHAAPYTGFGVRGDSGCSLAENDRVPAVKILVIDNYDSFVYNLVQYLAQIGAERRCLAQ